VSGVHRSPNIWDHPEVYEIENRVVDRAGVVEAAMERIHSLRGVTLLDIGCGTGFHLPRFAALGSTVIGVEPHLPLAARARARLQESARLGRRLRAQVLTASVEALPLAGGSVDVAHARWAYFFGAGSEPGLAELDRVMRPGGTAYVIDNDATRSTFGSWFRDAYPGYDPVAVERFWLRRGWNREPLDIRWDADTRADFEAVVRIEFSRPAAERILAQHRSGSVDYAIWLRWRHY
jgi:SAM-dependent methyltransferase